MEHPLIPAQTEGTHTNTESTAEFSSEQAARNFFAVARARLFTVNNWKKIAGAGADFSLRNEDGGPTSVSKPEPGQFICIDLPAPGPKAGDGNDWVRIDEVRDEADVAGMTVRPARSPENESSDVAHFFQDAASSTFMVRLESKKVIAGVYGRNEKPNTESKGIIDTIRNAAVAVGAITGFAKAQWKTLVKGIVETEE